MATKPLGTEQITINGISFSLQEIESVVDDFYTRIQQDELLKVPFQSVHDWPEHIQRLTHFWWIKFGGVPYQFTQYNPVPKHFFAGFNEMLLERWLGLFYQTLQTHLSPEQCELWKAVSERIGFSLTLKNEAFKKHHESQST